MSSETSVPLDVNGVSVAPALVCIIMIQIVSCWLFIKRVKKERRLYKAPSAIDFVFGVWTFILNIVLAMACAFLFNKFSFIAGMPKLDARAVIALCAGTLGVFVSIWVHFLCTISDSAATLKQNMTRDGFVDRMRMHTIFGIVASTTFMLLRV
jgi:hypothetical protein